MEHNPVLKNPLSLDSEIPLYSQLMGIIKRSITSGALKVGDCCRARPSSAARMISAATRSVRPSARWKKRLRRAKARQGHIRH